MKDKIYNILKSKIFIYIFLTIIIAAQITYITYIFAAEKTGFHSDEMYSYGLSNSHQNPFLTVDGYIFNEKYKNVNEWISGDELRNYLNANDGETFDYANVWYNQSLDRHPPLYYSVLHTICSFFPNQFSKWFGFSINLIVFVVLQIFLFLLAKKLFKSKWLAVLVCLCFGLSMGTINMSIYIRMYAMLTMWAVIMAYLHIKLLDVKDSLKLKSLIPITIIVMLGALTQHEFTLIAFVFAVCFCIRYLCKKQIKNFFKYGFSMLSGVALAWLVFPPLISQIFLEVGNDVGLRLFFIQIRLSIKRIFRDSLGLIIPTQGDIIYYSIVIPTFIILILLFAMPICFLFRKNEKFKAFLLRIRNFFKSIPERLKSFRPIKFIRSVRINFLYLPMLLAVIMIVILTSKSTPFIYMGYYDRYLFIIYPFAALIIMGVIICILSKLTPLKKANKYKLLSGIFFVGLLINSMLHLEPSYLFKSEKSIGNLSEITANSECIIVERSDDVKWRLVCFTSEMYNVDKVFYTSYNELNSCKDKIASLKTDKPIYIFLSEKLDIFDNYSSEEIINLYSDSLDFCDINSAEKLGEVSVFETDYHVYRLQ